MPSTSRISRLLAAIFIALVLVGVGVLLVGSALHKGLDHDENMYVAGGVLLARHSLWPYADYAYFQMPYLTPIYALLSGGEQLLLSARLFNVACAILSCLVIVLCAWLLPASLAPFYRAILGVSGIMLLLSNSSFIYASGIAWNHDLPVFLTILAVLLFCYTYKRGLHPLALLIAGALLGLAIGVRIAFLPALLPFVVAPLVWDRTTALGIRLRRCTFVVGGVLIALLPCAFFLLASLSAFIFGNLGYHQANELFRVQTGYTRAMTPTGKASYMFDVFTSDAAGWALVIALVAVGVYMLVSRRVKTEGSATSGGGASFLFTLCVALSLFAGALLPSPTWLQYFYAPVSLTVLAIVVGVAGLDAHNAKAMRRYIAVGLVAVVAIMAGIAAYGQYASLLSSAANVPQQVHNVGLEIRQRLGTNASKGKVMTFAPLLPLEGGLDIYPELEAGPFGIRVAPYLSESERQEFDVPGVAELNALMQREPPVAILVGYEPDLEAPLIEYAQTHHYTSVTLAGGGVLWLEAAP